MQTGGPEGCWEQVAAPRGCGSRGVHALQCRPAGCTRPAAGAPGAERVLDVLLEREALGSHRHILDRAEGAALSVDREVIQRCCGGATREALGLMVRPICRAGSWMWQCRVASHLAKLNNDAIAAAAVADGSSATTERVASDVEAGR